MAVLVGGSFSAAVAGLALAQQPFEEELQAKADAVARMEAINSQIADAAPEAIKRIAPEVLLPDTEPIPWDQGVNETREAPIPWGVIRVNSVWGQTVGLNHFSVYAGAAEYDPSQGMIVVQTYTLTGGHLLDEDFRAPYGTGWLRIVSASGHLLSLETETGSILVFDFDSRRFL